MSAFRRADEYLALGLCDSCQLLRVVTEFYRELFSVQTYFLPTLSHLIIMGTHVGLYVLRVSGHPGSYSGCVVKPKPEPRLPDSQVPYHKELAASSSKQSVQSTNQLDCVCVFKQIDRPSDLLI